MARGFALPRGTAQAWKSAASWLQGCCLSPCTVTALGAVVGVGGQPGDLQGLSMPFPTVTTPGPERSSVPRPGVLGTSLPSPSGTASGQGLCSGSQWGSRKMSVPCTLVTAVSVTAKGVTPMVTLRGRKGTSIPCPTVTGPGARVTAMPLAVVVAWPCRERSLLYLVVTWGMAEG